MASVPVVEAGTSSIYMTLHRLENLVEEVEARLRRIERSHSSLRRRVVARKAAAS
jgi:hypothetical protein